MAPKTTITVAREREGCLPPYYCPPKDASTDVICATYSAALNLINAEYAEICCSVPQWMWR